MGKSAKKSATKVVAAPAAAAAVTKPLKKGKRDADEIIEKPKSGKKQKNDVKDAIAKKIAEVKTVKKKVDTGSSEDDASDSEPEQKEPEKKVPVAAAKNVTNGRAVVAAKKDDSDSEEDDTGSEEDDVPAAIKKPAAIIAAADSSESDSEEESSDGHVPAAKAPATVAKTENESSDDSEDDGSEESSDKEEPEQEMKKVQKKEPKTPVTSKVQPSEGSKTLFVGNLPFSVEKSDIENFFKEVGEVVDVRLALRPDGEMKGYGHVEFASAADAKKAVEEMNGQELLGRGLRLDLAKERGEYTPQSGNAFQKQTIFIRGLDNNDDEFKIKDALKEHFGSCGEITRVSVPTDPEGCVKGIAYLDFTDKDALNKALKLDQSECGQSVLSVEEAKPRDSAGGGRGGRGGGGRFGSGGRDSGGRRGGRGGGGRGGRGGGGRFGGGGRGRY